MLTTPVEALTKETVGYDLANAWTRFCDNFVSKKLYPTEITFGPGRSWNQYVSYSLTTGRTASLDSPTGPPVRFTWPSHFVRTSRTMRR